MSIMTYLEADHAQLRLLFDLLAQLPSTLPERRAYVLDELRYKLLGHLQAEHRTFITAIQEITGEAIPQLERPRDASDAIGAALEALSATDPEAASWDTQLQDLRVLFEAHCAVIEGAAFARGAERLDDATAHALTERMDTLKLERIRAVESDGMPTDQDHIFTRLEQS